MKFIFLIQARLGSTRYPGKTLENIAPGVTLLESVYSRVLKAKDASKENVCFLIADSSADNKLAAFLKEKNIRYDRGGEDDLLFEYFRSFIKSLSPKPDFIFRICCDNPFIEPLFINEMADFLRNCPEAKRPDYLSYVDRAGAPAMRTHYGFFCEAISYGAFIRAGALNLSDIEKRHVTPQFYKSGEFTASFLPMPEEMQTRPFRFTVDTPDDLYIIRTIYPQLSENFSYRDALLIAQKHPDLMAIMKKTVAGDKKEGR